MSWETRAPIKKCIRPTLEDRFFCLVMQADRPLSTYRQKRYEDIWSRTYMRSYLLRRGHVVIYMETGQRMQFGQHQVREVQALLGRRQSRETRARRFNRCQLDTIALDPDLRYPAHRYKKTVQYDFKRVSRHTGCRRSSHRCHRRYFLAGNERHLFAADDDTF